MHSLTAPEASDIRGWQGYAVLEGAGEVSIPGLSPCRRLVALAWNWPSFSSISLHCLPSF